MSMWVTNARQRRQGRYKVAGLMAVFALAAGACGDDEASVSVTTAPLLAETTDVTAASDASAPEASEPEAPDASDSTAMTSAVEVATSVNDVAAAGPVLDDLIARANEEGSVTFYTSQAIANSENLAEAFMEKYPEIEVTVVRDLDTNSLPKVDAERETGHTIADLVIAADQVWLKERDGQGYFVPLETGRVETLPIDMSQYSASDNYVLVNAALFTYAWNTNRLPEGLDGYEALLAPELAGGNIGVIPPTSPSRVAYYMHLRDTYGEDFLPGLLAQEPHFYESSGQLRQGLISGEVAAAPYVNPPLEDMELGAPVDYSLPANPFGATFFAAVLEHASNPNAAQLLADFMLTPEGQAAISEGNAALLPDIEGTLASMDSVETADVSKLTSELVSDFQAEWESWK